ncbi:ribbon-helix-helix protein [Variovorax sp. ZT4R33]|uniref:ribbon-helix-helix protein n=1 Tax=Variovorax sp. ZT4R33 TaxID=3443743 RepID=UPI003F45C61E
MTVPTSIKTSRRTSIGRRPAADPATAWVHRENAGAAAVEPAKSAVFTARLTIDVTPALRGRIKVIAFERGITAADMLRELLEREYAEGKA